MKLRETLTLPLPASEAAAMYADEAYVEVRRRTLGADAASATVSGAAEGAFMVRSELSMPTDRVPDLVRPFVGSSVTVREEQQWSAPQADGARTGTMRLEVAGTPAGMTATLTLTPQGTDACTVVIDGDLSAKVPLLGPRLEKAAVPYVSTVLRAEERAAASYREGAEGTGSTAG